MANVSISDVSKVYPNGFLALQHLSLTVDDGEFVVLVGPSGCGKTTALRMVAGLEEITAGTIEIGDRVVNDIDPKDRDIAMVFQNYALYPKMTVRENVGFALKLRHMPKEQIAGRVNDAMALLGLADWADRKPAQLSGGQRQRVAMGRAIVREPSVFLMDEPLSNLDAKLRVQMRAEVARIHRRLGVATLYVTHDQVEAMTMGDRVAVLNAGVLQQVDSPQGVYDHPRNLFVAGFMGSPPMNLFEAVLAPDADHLSVGSQQLRLPASVLAEVPDLRAYGGQPVVLGIRPEDLGTWRAAGEDDARPECELQGRVDLIEALGSEHLIHFSTDARAVEVEGARDVDAEGLSQGTINRGGAGVARVDNRAPIRGGDTVRFYIDAASLRFFDPRTTDAIGFTATNGGGSDVGGHTLEQVRPSQGTTAAASMEPHGGREDHRAAAQLATEVIHAAPRTSTKPADTLHVSAALLSQIATRVPVPNYDRGAVSSGIVHFGVGGFHRAHQAMYIDALLNAGLADEWAICGVGVMPADRAMRTALADQNHLYTLVQKHSDGEYEPRIIGSIVDYLYAPDDAEAVVRRLADTHTKIVSLTITEGGYAIDDVTGRFNPEPAIARDLARGATPRTVFGLITASLERRRQDGHTPFTIMSCDNLPGNGALAREAFSTFADLRDPGLGDWVRTEVRFPNSMVDRITPATTDEDRSEIAARFGIEDEWPVVCEPFTQWVLEDSFGAGRPPLEEAGVQLVEDVAPYELMKLRLLNAGHQGLCYFGYLCGYTYAHEAAIDPVFRAFLRGYMDNEATPSLDPVPGVDLAAYKAQLIERFSNPQIRDTIARLCAESSDRIPKWVVPVIRYQLSVGGPVEHAAAIIASWARYAEGIDEHGRPIEIVDRRRDEVMARAARQKSDPTAFLRSPELFGNLASNERFVDSYLNALRSLHRYGARRTIETLARG